MKRFCTLIDGKIMNNFEGNFALLSTYCEEEYEDSVMFCGIESREDIKEIFSEEDLIEVIQKGDTGLDIYDNEEGEFIDSVKFTDGDTYESIIKEIADIIFRYVG